MLPVTSLDADAQSLLDLCKRVASDAGRHLLSRGDEPSRSYQHSDDFPREIKAVADRIMEDEILAALRPAGIGILSEESGTIAGSRGGSRQLIVDPLDGTYNFVKGLGPSAVSIALWESGRPIFGVVFTMPTQHLFWGGPGIGAFRDDQAITVSRTIRRDQAAICTGVPARANLSASATAIERLVHRYAKIRMLGSAAVALTHVADGSADAYAEREIMLWDVAAGLALVAGAGGRMRIRNGTRQFARDVAADNGVLDSDAAYA